ncbi:LuxR family transcriptional regulator [Actinoplanes friuliensis DSM 7358]|uniref:LuxR family transcriptional regulator n=1 Tax=Actinoplanes friuliensis DSM 7358 TaxID=1246995 RepID=U5W470_9ACTN|nr:LuxR family transcriptional regulator [Actinoplanes friuliensis DSM 7358]
MAAAGEGCGGVLFVVGEAGIGKSRLAAEAARLATGAGQCVVRGRATTSSAQYRALREAFMSTLRRTGPPGDPQLVPYRAALSRLVPEWQLTRPPGVDDAPVVLAEAVLRLLVSLGGGHGCVAVLEDLHDADADTLAVVDYLVDNLGQEPVLVVATVRSGPGAGADLVRAAGRRRAATVLELDRLDDGEVRELAALCLEVPGDRVPEPILTRLLEVADGVPFHVEELLADGGNGVPRTLSEGVAARADQLGPQGRALVQAAALLGRRFAATVAGEAAGVTGDDLATCLRLAADAQFVRPGSEPDVYVFRHALTAEALRGGMIPAEAARLARRAAQVIGERDEDLAAELWCRAGDLRRAAGSRSRLARRALAEGAVSTAIVQAERGLELVKDQSAGEPVLGELREVLLDALIDAGEVERAVELGTWLDLHTTTARRATVHLRLARAAAAAGQWAEGLRQIAGVRRLAGPDAEVDAVEAWLTFLRPAPDRMLRARQLAGRALENGRPEVLCAALEVLASCARTTDLEASRVWCDRALAVAEDHGLTTWRVRFLFHLGVLDAIHDADPARLILAHDTAVASGAVVTALVIGCELAVVHLTRGDHDAAERCAQAAETAAARLRLAETRLIALALRVCVAAHRGSREQTEVLYDRYRALGGDDIDHAAAVQGLGLAFCSLLEDNPERAWQDLDRAIAREDNHPPHYLSFNRGPYLLLATLAGKAGRAEHDELATSAHGQARWNRQFVTLSRAVLDGCEGNGDEAVAAVAEFEELATPYPLAHHLGLRLIGERAHADGWGRPRDWLTAAETYFHRTDSVRLAAACRTQLRDMGVPVAQRRRGSDRIPPALRRMGVTVREYEVLELLVDRLGNKEIAGRLFLSPRTVEKHVASLLLKTGHDDRTGLARFAVRERESG